MKSYTVYCKAEGNINHTMAQVRKVAPVTAVYQNVNGIGMNVITVFSPKIRDWVISILYGRNITIYGYRKVSVYEREYKPLTTEELAPHLKKFTVCKSSKGKYFIREYKSKEEVT